MIPQTSFYLLRHGESEANLAGKAAGGGVDSLLTPKGESQARDLAEVIHNLAVKPSMIFTSPMKRARRTAEIVNEGLNLPLTIEEHLEEHHVGEWEGQPWGIIGPKMIAGEIPPGGENYEQYAERVKRVLTPILEQQYETPPLIVAHGGTFRAIGHLYSWEIRRVQNCQLHRFDPSPDLTAFPFKVFEYNVAGIDLRECKSEFCSSNKSSF